VTYQQMEIVYTSFSWWYGHRGDEPRKVRNYLDEQVSNCCEETVMALNRYIENRKHAPPPPVPSELYIFNS